MDRVFMHLRCVRCPVCSRVFCCVKHRVEHQRRVHVDVLILPPPPTLPLIKRRFRSTTLENPQATTAVTLNNRKRLRVEHYPMLPLMRPPLAPSLGSGSRVLEAQQYHQTTPRPYETPGRNLLKAYRRSSSLSFIKNLRPVAESSPAMPSSLSSDEVRTPVGPSSLLSNEVHTPAGPSSLPSNEIHTPAGPSSLPSEEICTTAGPSSLPSNEVCTPAGPSGTATAVTADVTPSSFYHTPMQTLSDWPSTPMSTEDTASSSPTNAVTVSTSVNLLTTVSDPINIAAEMSVADTVISFIAETPTGAIKSLAATTPMAFSGTPITTTGTHEGPSTSSVSKQASLGREPTKKEFFWSIMARRLRLALQPALPKTALKNSPSPTTPNIDMAKYYSNIQSRPPINGNVSTPVHARLPLETLRQAHEEANKALKNKKTE